MAKLTRREFLKTAAAGAAGVAALSVMGVSGAQEAVSDYASRVTESIDCEVVVVGSGPSGLCAAVQAIELGLNTVLIEVNGFYGGNGSGTEGLFGVNSDFQKEKGIDISFREIITNELETFNYRIDATRWKDMVEHSADNLRWLYNYGVGLSGQVDNYRGYGEVETFHWFKIRESDGRGDGSLLTGPLVKVLEDADTVMMTDTRGMELIMQDGKVAGLYAVNTQDGYVIQFNAPVVILATAGFADNEEMMTERGYDMNYVYHRGVSGHFGDGNRMAVAVGAEDVSKLRTYLRNQYTFPLGPYSTTTTYCTVKGLSMWINQNGVRFSKETAGARVSGFASNAKMSQRKTYSVFDGAFVEKYKAEATDLVSDLEMLETAGYDNCFKADTIEELAEKAGFDPNVLKATVDRYNEFCANRYDEDYGKEPEYLIPITTSPFYILRQDMGVWTSIGGTRTNNKHEVVTPEGAAIPGLYAVGTEGCELYWDSYTINIPASCMGNNVNSGRYSAIHACEYIKG